MIENKIFINFVSQMYQMKKTALYLWKTLKLYNKL